MVEVQRQAAAIVAGVLAGTSLDVELAALRRKAAAGRERAAVQDLAYGTLRFLARLEAYLDRLLDRPLKDERLRPLLLVALYQLEFTRAAPHAVVDHAVRACRTLGLDSARGLVNAVLRNFLRRRHALAVAVNGDETARYGHPAWWIERLRAQYPGHYVQILEAGNRKPPLALRVNRRRTNVAEYLASLERAGMAARAEGESGVVLEKAVPVERIPGFAEGLVSVQDVAAQRAAPLLDLADGQRVLDACAAPGGKTGHILEIADVALTALDVSGERLERVRANLERLGLRARIGAGDACEPGTWWDGVPFERILADVPCTASGVVGRHPDIKWLRRESDVAAFAQRQHRMLDALWQTLTPGGKLLYATCSVFAEENDDQVARFLERHRDAARLALPAVENDTRLPAGQLLPDGGHDGFFYALLQKL